MTGAIFKKVIISLILVLLLTMAGLYLYLRKGAVVVDERPEPSSFEECVEFGYPILESYPRRCMSPDGRSFTEDIGNMLEKVNLIIVENVRPNQAIASPLEIKGQARGFWFFEATFPVALTDWDGLIIAEHYGKTQGEWMTEDFVPFEATLEFEKPVYGQNGFLVLRKNNPSGLPEHDDALEIPVRFE